MDEVIEKGKRMSEKLYTLLMSLETNYFFADSKVALKKVIHKMINGGTPSTNEGKFYSNGTIPWITTKTLNNDYTLHGEKLITLEAINKSAAKILPKGNILAGTRVGVGKFSINKIDISFSQDINGLFIETDFVDVDYLLFQLKSNSVQNKIKPLLRGTTIKGILKDDLLNLKITLPEKAIQIKVAKNLKYLKTAILEIESKIGFSKSLQKNLINQIF